MNLYLGIILLALLTGFVLGVLSGYLDLKALSTELPQEFEEYYDGKKYRTSQEYTRTKLGFGFIASSFNLIVTIVFILAGGFNYLDRFVRHFHFSELITGLLYFGLLFIIWDLISTPFSLYGHFVIEEKYGFNKLTPRIFILDKLKSYVLVILFGSLLLGAVLYFFEVFGDIAWLLAWLVTTAFTVLLQPLYIHFIAPWFNKFTPLSEGELWDAIRAYLKKVNFPIAGVFVMDASKRSTHSNAYFTGFGKFRRIVLFDTLISKHSNAEIVAILAHEVGHSKKKHILKGLIVSILHSGVIFYLLSIFIKNSGLFDAFKMEQMSLYAGLILSMLLYSPVELLLSFVLNYFSRKHEFAADHFAGTTMGDPNPMITGLKRLSADNLGNLTPHPLTVILRYDHPPVLQRILALRNINPEAT